MDGRTMMERDDDAVSGAYTVISIAYAHRPQGAARAAPIKWASKQLQLYAETHRRLHLASCHQAVAPGPAATDPPSPHES